MPDQLSPELIALRERVREFSSDTLGPLEATLPATAESADVSRELRATVRQRAHEAGLFGLTQPVAFGGLGAGPLALTVVRETLAASNLLTAAHVLGPGPGTLRDAPPHLRTAYLEPMLRGEKVAGFAFTEPSGPDAGRQTFAVPDGDDLLVTGRKSYVSNGPFCDFYTVLINVEPHGETPGGTAMLVVDRDTEGLTLGQRFTSMDGSVHCEIAFDRMRVPQAHLLGAVGRGMGQALGQIGEMRLAVAAHATGSAMWATDYVRQHITQPHRQGGTLGDREGVRRIFAEMLIETYAARATVYRTARLAETGVDVMNEGSAAKVFATEVVGRVADQAIQLVSGTALVRGHPLERLYREVRSLRIAEGPSDVLRLNIARGLLEFNAGRV